MVIVLLVVFILHLQLIGDASDQTSQFATGTIEEFKPIGDFLRLI